MTVIRFIVALLVFPPVMIFSDFQEDTIRRGFM